MPPVIPAEYGIDLDRQPGAMPLLAGRQVRDRRAATGAGGAAARSIGTSASRCSPAAPRGTSRPRPHTRSSDADDADGDVGDQAGEEQRHAESAAIIGDAVRRRHADRARRARSVAADAVIASHHVHDEEDDDPHRVDEVPVEGQHLGALGVLALHVPAQREDEHES